MIRGTRSGDNANRRRTSRLAIQRTAARFEHAVTDTAHQSPAPVAPAKQQSGTTGEQDPTPTPNIMNAYHLAELSVTLRKRPYWRECTLLRTELNEGFCIITIAGPDGQRPGSLWQNRDDGTWNAVAHADGNLGLAIGRMQGNFHSDSIAKATDMMLDYLEANRQKPQCPQTRSDTPE